MMMKVHGARSRSREKHNKKAAWTRSVQTSPGGVIADFDTVISKLVSAVIGGASLCVEAPLPRHGLSCHRFVRVARKIFALHNLQSKRCVAAEVAKLAHRPASI
ncbi:hypothetical protein [Sphingobium agri]|uniref:Transposase n=1 Tax=Sphingobium agri TaxID=2933566 RepID=A0ABT0DYR7_9SPHN|nr:hypothetical protein [Sphingobium agri]MCK0532235.1 hypothetical protein [Sphingobium agri]